MDKSSLSVFLLLSFVTTITAQQSNIAVLEKKLSQTKPDTNKVKLLNDLSGSYQKNDPDKGMDKASRGLKLSNELRWVKGIAISYRHIGNCYYYKSHPDSALVYFNKSLHLAEQIKDDEIQGDAFYALSFVYADDSHKDYSKALNLRLESLELKEKRGDKSGTLRMLMIVGETYAKAEKYDTAISYWLRSIKVRKTTLDTSYLSVYQNVGLAYMNQGKWQEAITYLQTGITEGLSYNNKSYVGQLFLLTARCYQNQQDFKNAVSSFENALTLFQQLKDMYWQAVVLNNIGGFYSDRQDYPNAIKYKLSSLAISDSINNKKLIGINENDIATDYVRIHDYNKAIDLLLKASVISEELKDTTVLVQVYANLGNAYHIKGDISKGKYYTQKSINITSSGNNKGWEALYLHDLGTGYLLSGNPSKAFYFFQHSLLLSEKDQDKNTIATTLGNLALAYLSILEKGETQKLPKNLQFPSPNKHFNYIISLVDSAIKLDTLVHDLNLLQAHYAILSTTYELKEDYGQALAYYKKFTSLKDSLFSNEKIRKIDSLERQVEVDKRERKVREGKLEIERQKSRTRIIVIVLSSAFIIALVSYYFLNKRKKYKAKLKLLNAELQVSDYERQLADSKLQTIDAKQEALNAQMSDHFVGSVMHSIKIFIDRNDKDSAVLYMERFRQLTRRVIKNASEKVITLQEDLDVVKDFIELEKLRFTENTFCYDIIVDPKIDPKNVLLPPMVLQILTENAIRHGFNKCLGGKLKIEAFRNDGVIQIIVQDNGIGRNAAGQTKREDTESFGTSLSERLIRLSSTHPEKNSYRVIDLLDSDELPIGTRVEITLPYTTN